MWSVDSQITVSANMRLLLPWDAEPLVYALRSPWPRQPAGASLVDGVITQDQPLAGTSRMVEDDVMLSDGVETDRLAFDAGSLATRIADSRANRVAAA